MDAFSGDAIPVHLLTREAYKIYWQHLLPDGVLAVHVSNRYLSLAPGVALAAAADGKQAMMIEYTGDEEKAETASDWVLVTSRKGFFDRDEIKPAAKHIDTDSRTSCVDGRLQQPLQNFCVSQARATSVKCGTVARNADMLNRI